jgi:hypothetical protein
MRGPAPVWQWTVVAAGALGILALTYAASRLLVFAALAIPLTTGITALAAAWARPGRVLAMVAAVGAILASSAPALTLCVFGAAMAAGLFLPPFFDRRPAEDDCYHIVPLVFLAVLAASFGIDRAALGGEGWRRLAGDYARVASQAQELQREAVGAADLPSESRTRWMMASRHLPFRLAGAAAALIGILFYCVTALVRPLIGKIREPKNQFAHFQVGGIYVLGLAAGLACMAGWIALESPWLGYLAYGMVFFSGAGLFLGGVSLGTFAVLHLESRKAAVAAYGAAVAAMIGFPILIAACALAGLADVWLDFRNLDRILGGFQE